MLQPAIRRVPIPDSAALPARSRPRPAEQDADGSGTGRVRLGGLSIGASLCLHGTLLLILALLLVARREPRPAAVIDSVLLDAAPIEEPVFVGADLGGAEPGRLGEQVAIGELLTPSDEVLDLAAISGGTGDAGSGAGDGAGFFGTHERGAVRAGRRGTRQFVAPVRAAATLPGDLLQLEGSTGVLSWPAERTRPRHAEGSGLRHHPDSPAIGRRRHGPERGTGTGGVPSAGCDLPVDGWKVRDPGAGPGPGIEHTRRGDPHAAGNSFVFVVDQSGSTIAIGYRESEPILRGIAEDHGGRYRFVP